MHSDQKTFYCIIDSFYNNSFLIARMTQRKQFLKIKLNKYCTYLKNSERTNILRFDTLFTNKILDGNSKYLKAQISLHENKYCENISLKTDSETCPPIELIVLL